MIDLIYKDPSHVIFMYGSYRQKIDQYKRLIKIQCIPFRLNGHINTEVILEFFIWQIK